MWWSVAIAAMWVAQANPDQFDLICKVTHIQYPDDHQARELVLAMEARLKIDLASRRWCMGRPAQNGLPEVDCQQSSFVKSASPTSIVLQRFSDDGTVEINRESGAYISDQPYGYKNEARRRMHYLGKCDPRPFTGLPSAKF